MTLDDRRNNKGSLIFVKALIKERMVHESHYSSLAIISVAQIFILNR